MGTLALDAGAWVASNGQEGEPGLRIQKKRMSQPIQY